MILFVYLIVVIVMMSKQKSEGKVVSGWTRFLVYSLLVLSLLSLLASSLAVSLFSLPLLGFLLMAAILKIAYFVRLVIAFGLIFLSLTLYLDSQKVSNIHLFSVSAPALWLSHSIDISYVLNAKLHLQYESGVDFYFFKVSRRGTIATVRTAEMTSSAIEFVEITVARSFGYFHQRHFQKEEDSPRTKTVLVREPRAPAKMRPVLFLIIYKPSKVSDQSKREGQ